MGLFKKKKKLQETAEVPVVPKIANYSGFGAIVVEDGVDSAVVPKQKKKNKPLLEPFVKDGVKYIPVVYYVPEDQLYKIDEDKPRPKHAYINEEDDDDDETEFDLDLSNRVCAATKTNHEFTLHRKSKDGKIWFFTDEQDKIYSVPAEKL